MSKKYSSCTLPQKAIKRASRKWGNNPRERGQEIGDTGSNKKSKENPHDGSKKRAQGDSDAGVVETTCPDQSTSEDNTEIFIENIKATEYLKHLEVPRRRLHYCGSISKSTGDGYVKGDVNTEDNYQFHGKQKLIQERKIIAHYMTQL